MSDINNGPVTLGAGSYDYDDLKKGLDKAAAGKPEKYHVGVADAVTKAGSSVFENSDPRTIPGYKFVDVENDTLGTTENVQVFDAHLAKEQGDTGAIPAADLINRQAETRADAAAKADSPSKE